MDKLFQIGLGFFDCHSGHLESSYSLWVDGCRRVWAQSWSVLSVILPPVRFKVVTLPFSSGADNFSAVAFFFGPRNPRKANE
jgi:hypothetical protein